MTNFDPDCLKLYLVTERSLLNGRDLGDVVASAVKGGVSCVQLREKHISTGEFIRLGLELRDLLRPFGVPLIVNDRVDVALAIGADGVHIGQSDMPWNMARELMGPDKIIGLSVENMDEVVEANEADVDYIGVSPVFSTPTKTDTALPFGLDGLAGAVAISRHPTVAIGGINAANASSVFATGVNGIAVVSAIIASPDPESAARELNEFSQML